MRAIIINWVLLGLVSALLLVGCSRDRLRSQEGQTSAGDINPTAAVQPTTSQGDASSADISQAADDLTSFMNGLSKDLDATDTLDDVK